MLDPFDYKEPSCALCGGKEFYNPQKNAPIGTIPVNRIIEKLDGFFNKNDMDGAKKLLEFWNSEAKNLKDKKGELSITDELVGFYRKTGDKEKGLLATESCVNLIDQLKLNETVSAGTIYLNCATTKKAFGYPQEALILYDKAFEIYDKNLDENDERFAGFYNNKALALSDLKRYEQATECFNKALSVVTKLENGLPDTAVTYVNMAHNYHDAGQKDKITDCLFKAHECLNDDRIVKNGYYAYVCEKCAPSFEFFGYTVIANQLKKEAKEIYERD